MLIFFISVYCAIKLIPCSSGCDQRQVDYIPTGFGVCTENGRLSGETVQTRVFTTVAGLNLPGRGNFSVNTFL